MAKNVTKETDVEKKKRTSPAKFIDEVRKELRKVTWPDIPEWRLWTIMVFIMVAIASIFFFLVDTVIGKSIQFILGLGS